MPFLPILTKIGSASFRRRVVQAIPSHNVKRMAQVVDDMDHTASEVFNRKKEILSGEVAESTEGLVGEGKDLLTGLRTCCNSLALTRTSCLRLYS